MGENEILKDLINKITSEVQQNNFEKLQDSLPKSKEIIDNPKELDIIPENLTIVEAGERSSIVQNNQGVYFLQNNTTRKLFHPTRNRDEIEKEWFENNME